MPPFKSLFITFKPPFTPFKPSFLPLEPPFIPFRPPFIPFKPPFLSPVGTRAADPSWHPATRSATPPVFRRVQGSGFRVEG